MRRNLNFPLYTLRKIAASLAFIFLSSCSAVVYDVPGSRTTTLSSASATLVTPVSGTGSSSTPTLQIQGGSLAAGMSVKVFSDASCRTEVAAAAATSTSIQVNLTLASEGSFSFYHTLSNGTLVSSCASLGVTYVYDATRPSVSLEQASAQSDPATDIPINFTVTFSEAIDPATFTSADVTFAGTASGVTWAISDSGDHKSFELSATVVTVEGTLSPSVLVNSVSDLAGNLNTASTSSDNTVTVDLTRTLYLRSSGNDANDPDTSINDPSRPFATAQGVVDAVLSLSTPPSAGDPLIINVGAGSFGHVTLTSSFGQHVTWIGVDETTSFIGNINARGSDGASGSYDPGLYDPMLLSCVGTSASNPVSGGNGHTIYIRSNRSVRFGSINSSGGSGGGGAPATLDCQLIASFGAAQPGAAGGSGGTVYVIDASTGSIEVIGGPGGSGGSDSSTGIGAAGANAGNGGAIYLSGNSAVGHLFSNGGDGGSPGSGGFSQGSAGTRGSIDISGNSSAEAVYMYNGGGIPTGCMPGGWLYLSANAIYLSFSTNYDVSMCGRPTLSQGGVCRAGSLTAQWSGAPNSGQSNFSLSQTGSYGYYDISSNQGIIENSSYDFGYTSYSGTSHTWTGDGGAPVTITITDAACSNITTTLSGN